MMFLCLRSIEHFNKSLKWEFRVGNILLKAVIPPTSQLCSSSGEFLEKPYGQRILLASSPRNFVSSENIVCGAVLLFMKVCSKLWLTVIPTQQEMKPHKHTNCTETVWVTVETWRFNMADCGRGPALSKKNKRKTKIFIIRW